MRNAYADISYADDYFAMRAFADVWTPADDNTKQKFLATASALIREYCTFMDDNGSAYTYDDAEGVDWLKRATCEEALYLLALGKDPTAADKKTTLGVKSTDGTVFDKAFAADILCVWCRQILEENGGIVSPAAAAASKRLTQGKISK